MKNILIIIMASIMFSGCLPGEAEFIMKTSEIRKALTNGVGQIMVHEKVDISMSNEYYTVINHTEITNSVELTKRLLRYMNLGDPDKNCMKSSNLWARAWVDELVGKLPRFKLDAMLSVAIGSSNVVSYCNLPGDCSSILYIESDTGYFSEAESGLFSKFGSECFVDGYLHGFEEGFGMAVGEENEILKPRISLDAINKASSCVFSPEKIDNITCTIECDDESMIVVAKDVTIDEKRLENFERTLDKGDRISIKLNHVTSSNHGGISFKLVNNPS